MTTALDGPNLREKIPPYNLAHSVNLWGESIRIQETLPQCLTCSELHFWAADAGCQSEAKLWGLAENHQPTILYDVLSAR